MSDKFMNDSLVDVFIHETNNLMNQLWQKVLTRDQAGLCTIQNINEIFRIIHTIKGSSAMMGYDQITALTHSMEDLFSFIRDEHPAYIDRSTLINLILAGIDFIKEETNDIKEGGKPTGDPAELIEENRRFLRCLKVYKGQTRAPGDHKKEFKYVVTDEVPGDIEGLKSENYDKTAHRLELITKEMQDVVSVQVASLSITFIKMHRIVRDMSKKLNKDVLLKTIGEETVMDQNLIEYISISLMHLVRNAVDHGLESPEERIKNGKPETGTVTIEAKNSGPDVLISVKDDGKGLDTEEILKKAKERNCLYKGVTDMTDQQIVNLIFLPGFSTNESVTEYSGRGVGMDVVVKNIEAVKGTVLVDSSPGKGTVFTIKVPGINVNGQSV